MQANVKKSWFKQFWPWFLIILPMAAVVAGISTVVIATHNKPEMVVDDYYKTGKAINADLSLLKKAQALGITAVVTQQEEGLVIKLNGMSNKASVRFSLYHSTQSNRDIALMLTSDAQGNYYYKTDASLTGKWTMRIEPFDKQWRLQKNVKFPMKEISL